VKWSSRKIELTSPHQNSNSPRPSTPGSRVQGSITKLVLTHKREIQIAQIREVVNVVKGHHTWTSRTGFFSRIILRQSSWPPLHHQINRAHEVSHRWRRVVNERRWPNLAAQWRGVLPAVSRVLTDIPESTTSFRNPILPLLAASCIGLSIVSVFSPTITR